MQRGALSPRAGRVGRKVRATQSGILANGQPAVTSGTT